MVCWILCTDFSAMAPERETAELEKHLSDALPILDSGYKKVTEKGIKND